MVVGPNGHGKTSLIEALLYGEVFRSFRGASDRELVRFGADGFRVVAAVLGEARGANGVAAGYDARTGAKKVTVDGLEPARLADAIGIVRGVVLSPADVRLVAGGPRERRHYLDVLLALTVGGYVEALAKYRRALRHRVKATAAELDAWEQVLAESGERIWAARRAWVERWAARYAEHCVAIGETGGPEEGGTWERGAARTTGPALAYLPRTDGGAAALREALLRSREKDLARGRTGAGPHRDELRLSLGGRDLRLVGSAGQQRTAALALRLLEAETLHAATGSPAAICLDDAFAELDDGRSRRLGALIELLAEAGAQVIAAVPKETDLPHVVGMLPRWNIRDGRIH